MEDTSTYMDTVVSNHYTGGPVLAEPYAMPSDISSSTTSLDGGSGSAVGVTTTTSDLTCAELRTKFDSAKSDFWKANYDYGKSIATFDIWGAEDAYYEAVDALGSMKQWYNYLVYRGCLGGGARPIIQEPT